MADDKKIGKPTGKISNNEATEKIVGLLLLLVFLSLISTALLNYFNSLGFGDSSMFGNRISSYFLEHIWPVWKIIAGFVGLAALGGIIYNFLKLRAINIAEDSIFRPALETIVTNAGVVVTEQKNTRWEKIMEYLNSENSSDWRQAILEADIMLDELLRSLGYVGESLGDLLKAVLKEDFLAIDDAWEAHKVRNTVAHSGADFQLNLREAKRVIGLYENVFNEFDLI